MYKLWTRLCSCLLYIPRGLQKQKQSNLLAFGATLLLISVLSSLHYDGRDTSHITGKNTTAFDLSHARTADTTDVPYDLLLSAYWRSGSTYTGRLLGHHNDTFYIYEPLQKNLEWELYIGSNIYSIRRPPARDPFTIGRSLEILDMIYSCNFTGFGPILTPQLQCSLRRAGPRWQNLTMCAKRTWMKRWFPELTRLCNTSRHLVTKVLRINPMHAELLMRKHPRLKTLHLFRDPRAVMFSLYTFQHSPLHKTRNMSELYRAAQLMCEKMMYDYTTGMGVRERLPSRFKFIKYEDIVDNGDVEKNKLYAFINMHHRVAGSDVMSHEDEVTKKHVHGSNWRLQIPWEIVKLVDRACSHVYAAVGYIPYKNIQQLRNISLSVTKLHDTMK